MSVSHLESLSYSSLCCQIVLLFRFDDVVTGLEDFTHCRGSFYFVLATSSNLYDSSRFLSSHQ